MLRTVAFRLRPGEDLRVGLERVAAEQGLQAAIVLTCVGSLSRAALRMAGVEGTTTIDGDLEILSLVGTLSPDGSHLHLTVSDASGAVTGGHAQVGSLVRTTAEVVLGELDDVVFSRPLDPATGWDELEIHPRQSRQQVLPMSEYGQPDASRK